MPSNSKTMVRIQGKEGGAVLQKVGLDE